MKAHLQMKASGDLQIPGISMTDFLPEGDLQRGDPCLEGEIAGWDLEHSGKITGSSFPTISLKNAFICHRNELPLCQHQELDTEITHPCEFTGTVLVHFVANAWLR